ncbi:MAG TPA: tRNA (cytidine(56)-2'-O)-methyltransferase [Candidatus Aenigmarchaeota archaeon]|nr:MAG: tRNA (cytidine(56)-2'-O)-methyltransferase [Candidatus Aenigmarchaeota archaeon]HDD45907.1 tRNA (cytidine(56)-2'-O)-methyltransferase [Candidatus Aenigmarchaeota archaeon]
MNVYVLRLGHRIARDKRISTHCGLVARAFGAAGIIYSGERDSKLIESIEHVCKIWGNRFDVSYERNWKKVVERFSKHGIVVHLTMYGLPLYDMLGEIKRKGKDILVVVGGEKVPAELYKIATYNVSIGTQPHSEIAAIAIFLHELFEGKELTKEFEDAKIKIVPQKSGKKTIKINKSLS